MTFLGTGEILQESECWPNQVRCFKFQPATDLMMFDSGNIRSTRNGTQKFQFWQHSNYDSLWAFRSL